MNQQPNFVEFGGLAQHIPLSVVSRFCRVPSITWRQKSNIRRVCQFVQNEDGIWRLPSHNELQRDQALYDKPVLEVPWTRDFFPNSTTIDGEVVLDEASVNHAQLTVPHGWSVSLYSCSAPIQISGDIHSVSAELVGDISINTTPSLPHGHIAIDKALRVSVFSGRLVTNPQSIAIDNVTETRIKRHSHTSTQVELLDINYATLDVSNTHVFIDSERLVALKANTEGICTIELSNETAFDGCSIRHTMPQNANEPSNCLAVMAPESYECIYAENVSLQLSDIVFGFELISPTPEDLDALRATNSADMALPQSIFNETVVALYQKRRGTQLICTSESLARIAPLDEETSEFNGDPETQYPDITHLEPSLLLREGSAVDDYIADSTSDGSPTYSSVDPRSSQAKTSCITSVVGPDDSEPIRTQYSLINDSLGF